MMLPSRIQATIFIVTCALTISGYYIVRGFYTMEQPNFHRQFYIEGYDFRQMHAGDVDFAKYKVGETIDLANLISTDGDRTLITYNKSLILFVIVDPECPYSKISSDIYTRLRENLDLNHVQYVPVVLTSRSQDYPNPDSYVNSLGFPLAFSWKPNFPPTGVLENIPTPAHILVNDHGLVLRIWFSSSTDKAVRNRMANQIIKDVNLLSEVLVTAKGEN